MRTRAAITTTDQVNLQMMQTTLSSLVHTIEMMIEESVCAQIAPGMPINVSHDKHLPIGWCVPQGVYVARDMGRQLALMHFGETDEERERIAFDVFRFRQNAEYRRVEPYADALRERLAGFVDEETPFRYCEAAAICRPGLAADVYPEYFARGGSFVDKDGLVQYDALRSHTTMIAPGLFHERKRDLILFAHPSFRRNLSRDNSLNAYVLRSFDEAARLDDVGARLRLDPDMLGHPANAGPAIELEYWGGPRFDDDIEKIKSGVSEHKSTDRERSLSRIDRTQIWWKNPEARSSPSGVHGYRTFEIEELIEETSVGLGGDWFGCRYAHAEYDLAGRFMSHFDGAIRAYEGDSYLDRLDRRIDRAGKQADYQKLFRLDGRIPVASWKAILTDYFRGNLLVPEYLGSPIERAAEPEVDENQPDEQLPALSFFVGVNRCRSEPPAKRQTRADHSIDWEERRIQLVETGPGALAEVMEAWTDRSRFALAECNLATANLSPVHLAGAEASQAEWTETVDALSAAIRSAVAAEGLALVSVTIRWRRGPSEISFSIAGDADLVTVFLKAAADIVDVTARPSAWVEALRDLLADTAPELAAAVDWPGSCARIGRIIIPRPDDAMMSFRMPLPGNANADESAAD